jgi:DNA-binding GntR family transcriptional regulator
LSALRATQVQHLGAFTTRTVAERVVRIHTSIVDAIEAHDAELASERMTQHLERIAAF